MSLKDYLIFFRWKNVLMILLIQFLFKYVLFKKFDIQVTLDDFHFILLAISTASVAIAGYIINDVNDVKADIVNKPEKLFVDKKITRIAAQNLFIAFNSIGLVLGMYLSYHVGNTSYFIIYVLTSLLLYQYAKHLKKRIIIGNILVSFIVSFCILMVAVFDMAPATNNYNLEAQRSVLYIFLLFAGFGFLLTLIREIVKDMEDMEGDMAIEARSIPIVFGETTTRRVVVFVAVLLIALISLVCFQVYDTNKYIGLYLSCLVSLPMLYFTYKLVKSRSKADYHKLSGLLKLIMLLGILSVFVI